MAVTKVAHPSVADRRAMGADARIQTPLELHSRWEPAVDRPDPVRLLEEQNANRDPDLVPIRHGRMMMSPFTFYRGAARIMANDLARTPTAGLITQLCGDAHLFNFGVFASPERQLLFDLNDFDETLPGPFEYDVKRMAASFTIAARNNGLTEADGRSVTLAAVRAYREAMTRFAGMGVLETWYSRISEDDLQAIVAGFAAEGERKRAAHTHKKRAGHNRTGKRKHHNGAKTDATDSDTEALAQRAERNLRKARTRDSMQALSKIGEMVDGHYRIVSRPPIIIPLRDLDQHYGMTPATAEEAVHEWFREFRSTLEGDRRHLLERFEIIDIARKVVGVGSVGTRAFIVLLQGRDAQDPLFLQLKEATQSVLEDHLPKSRYHNPGERVVRGQRIMQASSDIFLGWTKGIQANRYYYVRQLRDMKGSALVDTMPAIAMQSYAGLCGWALARAHARSGDAIAIDAYLANTDDFDRSVSEFSRLYADQNDQDYQAFVDAVHSGRITATEGM